MTENQLTYGSEVIGKYHYSEDKKKLIMDINPGVSEEILNKTIEKMKETAKNIGCVLEYDGKDITPEVEQKDKSEESKKISVRDGFNRLADLLEDGKGFWELEFEDRKTGEKLKNIQLVAIKPDGETLTCLFG